MEIFLKKYSTERQAHDNDRISKDDSICVAKGPLEDVQCENLLGHESTSSIVLHTEVVQRTFSTLVQNVA